MSLYDDMKDEEQKTSEEDEQEDKPVFELQGIRIVSEGEDRRSITTGITSDYKLVVTNNSDKKDKVRISADLIAAASLGEDAAEWTVTLKQEGSNAWEVTKDGLKDKEIEIKAKASESLTLNVSSPRGARYGDTMNVIVTATSATNPALSDSVTLRTTAQQSVLAIKTQIGHERTVADTLGSRSEGLGVQSILCPQALRGYIVVEAMNTDRLAEAVRSIKRARGVVDGEMSFDEINHYLTPKPLVSGIVEGDIVELIAGPFKGEKARVQMIDEGKEEITVELFEALVPIPVTVKGDSVRVIEKDG